MMQVYALGLFSGLLIALLAGAALVAARVYYSADAAPAASRAKGRFL